MGLEITLTFSPSELRSYLAHGPATKSSERNGLTVVVIDVLRACSTITHALSQGCKAVYPFASINECLKKAKELGHENVTLGGERGCVKIKGFQLGNSPKEYSRETVEGKYVFFTTTNCTKNLHAISQLGQIKEGIICSFLNLPAVSEYLTKTGGWVHLALSGTGGKVSLEDVVCGGMLIQRLLEQKAWGLSDSARLAYITYLHYKDNIIQALRDSNHGRRLIELGMEKDLAFCSQVGLYNLIPRISEWVIKLEKENPQPNTLY